MAAQNGTRLTVSIVSHGHGSMVARLSEQLLALPEVGHLIVTLNIDENLELPRDGRIQVVRNKTPKGFGANHNAAFKLCETEFYCVVNPDIELPENPFPALLKALESPDAGLAAPLVRDARAQVEDSWRKFPSPVSLMRKAISGYTGSYLETCTTQHFFPDWVAGMFLLFQTRDYAALKGFDEGFFLYYEDVDICARLHKAGRKIIGSADIYVVHKAQRASWHSWQYRRFHLASMLRYFSRDWRRLFPAMLRRSGH